MEFIEGLDNIQDWDEYDSKSPLKMGLKNPKGYGWYPEQDQGDGGSSFFRLFRLKPWDYILAVYPSYTYLENELENEDEYVRTGVEVRYADVIICKVARIKDVSVPVIQFCKKYKP